MLGLDRVIGLDWVLNFPLNSFICLVNFACNQQHPQFEFNKIKTKFVPPCVPVVGAHVCTNHTPVVMFCQVRSKFERGGRSIRSRENGKNSGWKSSRAAYTRLPGLRSSPSQPTQVFRSSINRACTPTKRSRSFATGAGRPVPPVSHTPSAFAW